MTAAVVSARDVLPRPPHPAPSAPAAPGAAAPHFQFSTAGALPTADECRAIGAHVFRLVNDDSAVAAELLASLLETNQADLHDIQIACAEKNWADVRAHAHRIKNTAQLSGAGTLAVLCHRVEALAEQRDGQALQSLLGVFSAAVQRLSHALQGWANLAATQRPFTAEASRRR